MKAVKLSACCLLTFSLIGPMSSSRSKSGTKLLDQPADVQRRRAPILAFIPTGRDLFRTGHYSEAIRNFQNMREHAEAAHFADLAARAQGNIGACELALHQYQSALHTMLDAHRMAEAAGDTSAAAIFDANIASLYSELGEFDAAAQWTQGILDRLSPKDRRESEPKLLLQLATLRARQQRMPEAEKLFAGGLDAADRAGDVELYATGWNRLGEEYLKQHNLAAAEGALVEAYRIRALNRLPLDSSYRSLGLLRLEQGDFASASALLDRAVELSSRPQGPLPAWNMFHARGRARLARNRLRDALDDLRIAARLAREWRWSAPADDAARIGSEGWLDGVNSDLIEAGNRLYLETHDPALIRETFDAAEESRAGSLRALIADRGRNPAAALPPEYWEALGRLQRAEVQALRTGSTPDREVANAARAELTRIEVAIGPAAAPLPSGLADRARAALDGDTALLAFHGSWLWAMDREGLVLHRVASDYPSLFAALEPRFQSRTRWLIAGLFEVPLASLRIGNAYLVEKHEIQIVPGVVGQAAARPFRVSPANTLFVGVADPIYNTADPRGKQKSLALQLPRLVATAREVEAGANAWRGDRVLLEGAAASRAGLVRQLQRDPAVVHVAVHVLESSDRHGLLALSSGDLLSPQEIAGWRTHASLVVLSGCHSAEGPILPGTGLLGLTRAWLAAGARSVIASHWATPDESGALFSALYRHLSAHGGAGPAAALRAAQIEMIRAGGWRAEPQYWGAYFVMGTP